jgi:antitoxin (DNA-binding transcriptional repressor) of toxin-antitoxin stability system
MLGPDYSRDMKVSIEYAAEHFEELVSAVQSGEAVEIECVDEPGVRLIPLSAVETALRLGEL